MKKINLLFDFYIPITLREYRFFEIGKNHQYFDDYNLELTTVQIANNSIRPFLSLIENTFDQIVSPAKISLSITGSTLSLLHHYAPDIIERINNLNQKGYIKNCSTTFTNSILSNNPTEFIRLIKENNRVNQHLFGNHDNNFNLINQPIGSKTLNELLQFQPTSVYLSEEQAFTIKNATAAFVIADHFLSKQFNQLMSNNSNGFGDTAKVSAYLDELEIRSRNKTQTLIQFKPCLNNYNFGISQQVIFQELIEGIINRNYAISPENPTSINEKSYPFDIVFHKEEFHNLSTEINEMQQEVIELMCSISEKLTTCRNDQMIKKWLILQEQVNLDYISSKYLEKNYANNNSSPYNGPYQAFMNFINILSDFELTTKKETEKSYI